MIFGSISPFAGSDAVQEQSVLSTAWNRSVTTLESAQLSELRTGEVIDRDFTLVANVESNVAFVWPAYGDITSHMDSSHPMGIDIALDYDSLSPIVAAAGGTVSFAGGDDSYGYYVKVDHGGGLVTLYAHLDEILVTEGQIIGQGELLGYGGSTGKSSGKHLHFEVRQGAFLANPLELLPELSQPPLALPLDCSNGALVLERGSYARLDFAAGMPGNAKITSATVNVKGESHLPQPSVELLSDKTVRIATPPHIEPLGVTPDAWYSLALVIEDSRRFEKKCDVQVQTVASSLIAYSEASVQASYNGSPYEEDWVEPEYTEPVEVPREQPVETPVEPTPLPPVETPLVVPTGIPLLGNLATPEATPTATPEATPTATPEATPTATPEATATPVATATPTASPTPQATATPEPTVAPQSTATKTAE